MAYEVPGATAVNFAAVSGYTPPVADAVDFAVGESGGWAPPASIVSARTIRYGTRPTLDRGVVAKYGVYAQRDRRRRLPWAAHRIVQHAVCSGWASLTPRDHRQRLPWTALEHRPEASVRSPWRQLIPRNHAAAVPWDALRAADPAGSVLPWRYPPARDVERVLPWHSVDRYSPAYPQPRTYTPPPAEGVHFGAATGYTSPPSTAVDFWPREAIPPRPVQPRQSGRTVTWRARIPARDTAERIPWGPMGRADAPGITIPYPVEPDPPPPDPPPLPPEAEVYLLMPSLSAARVADNAEIWVTDAQVSTDRDSWCWDLRATLARPEDLAALSPTANGQPQELELAINGYTWVFVIEGYDRQTARDGDGALTRGYSVRGRSRSAFLSDRYFPARSKVEGNARSAQQLASAELTNSGWSLVWDTQDWHVPGGTWSYEAMTPIAAVRRIAEAAGAVVVTHPAQRTLTVEPRYPVSPWAWADAVADIALTDYAWQSLSLDYEPGPPYNRVFVAGEQGGVLVSVGRSGTAQDVEADMVVDRLITEPLAGRERGRQILAAAGNKARVPITAWLFPEPDPPGLVLPGRLVEVTEDGATWRGQAMSVSITARWESALTVRQQIEVERFYG